jgi:CO dehydrogenase maturation factor
MTKTLTVAGKGGVGKTAISSLIIDQLSKKGVVLAVDADPSTNLNEALGLELPGTVGQAREDITEAITKGTAPPTVPKQDLLDMRIREALVEAKNIDLLAMGRPEGPGCYCAANHMLRLSMERLSKHYDFVVTDSEAGMEHISRQTTQDVDFLLIVSDPTIRGLTAAARVQELIKEMRTHVGKVTLVVNRVRNGLPEEIGKAVKDFGLNLIAVIPEDPNLADLEIQGKPIIALPEDSPLKLGAKEIIEKAGM